MLLLKPMIICLEILKISKIINFFLVKLSQLDFHHLSFVQNSLELQICPLPILHFQDFQSILSGLFTLKRCSHSLQIETDPKSRSPRYLSELQEKGQNFH